MTVELKELDNGKVLEVHLTGKLIKEDYETFLPAVERLTIVGETKWEKGMAAFCKPFTTAKSRYFDRTKPSKVRDWLAGK